MVLTRNLKKGVDILKRHLEVFEKVADHGPVGILRLSRLTSLPNHQIRYSLRVLEDMGYIAPSSQGAIATITFIELSNHLKAELVGIACRLEQLKDDLEKV